MEDRYQETAEREVTLSAIGGDQEGRLALLGVGLRCLAVEYHTHSLHLLFRAVRIELVTRVRFDPLDRI